MKQFISILLVFLSFTMLNAQRQMETLDRGLVAVKTVDGVFLSWRLTAEEWYGVRYNVYQGDQKLNAEPLEVSNFTDPNGTTSSSYKVAAVVDGVEQALSEAVQPWAQQYMEIPMVDRPEGYAVNDATAADLDGDGEYEIIVKRIYADYSVECVNFAYFEAYKMDGTLMWEINVGPNIISSSSVEINIAAFDFDEDGKAEVFLRTSEGTIFGDGAKIGDTDNDGKTNYRYSMSQEPNKIYPTRGPEFLSLVDGETGVELDRVDFIPRYPGTNYPTNDQYEKYWGDGYGHRSNKFFFGAPYLDGIHPSLFIGRGIYTRTMMQTYDVVDKKLVPRWYFTTDDYPECFGQGNHNYTVADVDEDGKDEIVWGGMTVDDDGTALYSTQLGHGDALHVGDLDPFRKGTEIWRCLEESPNFGTSFYDGATGDLLIHDLATADCGRCMAANVSDKVVGASMWGSTTIYSATTKKGVHHTDLSSNYRIYWDGDLLEELQTNKNNAPDGVAIIHKPDVGVLLEATGTKSCNWTKGTPTLQADLFGDWREEVIWRTTDDSKIRIYTTIDPTPYRNYTLMHDHQYRQAICWQMCGYNQPPHVSYFLGEAEGMTVPPPPSTTNGRLVYQGNGDWTTTSDIWKKDAVDAAYADGEHVLFDVLNGMDVSLKLEDVVAPQVLTVNSPGDYTLDAAAGKLSGGMELVKQGLGTFYLNGTHDFSGKTEVWNGRLALDGDLLNSPVWLNVFAELSAQGELGGGVVMRYGSKLYVGGENDFATLNVNDSLTLEKNASLVFDVQSTPEMSNDSLLVEGKLLMQDGAAFTINAHLASDQKMLAGGEYVLVTATGGIEANLEEIEIKGILGTLAKLEVRGNDLILVIVQMRQPAAVVWSGAGSSVWDLFQTANFLNQGVADVFVTDDIIEFKDDAINKTVSISEEVSPKSVAVNADNDYIFDGEGGIAGASTLTKEGAGQLSILNSNSFTGKIALNEGRIKVQTLPNNLSEDSPLGPVSSNANLFVINGGELEVSHETLMDRAIAIGSQGAIVNNARLLTWNGHIQGYELIKMGNGELILNAANTNSELTIRQGTVRLREEGALPGQRVNFEGGTLRCYDNYSTYSSLATQFYVGEGDVGTLYMDGRCTYTGSLSGAGVLNVNIPWIRTDFKGNWSNFSGTININADAWFRNYNSYGYGKAIVNLPAGANMTAMNGQTIRFGSLIGAGKVSGASSVKLGMRNEDFSFEGDIEAGSVVKKGSGILTLEGELTTSGNITIESGGIIAKNSIGKSVSGRIYINDGAFLAANRLVNKHITVKGGGTLYAGLGPYWSLAGGVTTVPSVMMESNSVYSVKTNPRRSTCDYVKAATSFQARGTLQISIALMGEYAAGQSFQIVKSPSITGTFSAVEPAVPAEGLEWDFSEFNTSGVVSVVAATPINDHIYDGLSLYPNPTRGNMHVELGKVANNLELQLVNLSGQVVKQARYVDVAELELNMSDLESGIYIIQMKLDDMVLMRRVVLEE